MNKKILIADDSKTALMMETMILKGGPYDVIHAHNGQEAVEVALAERPDLILLDVVMPVLDGFEACRAIRANEEIRETPIIMVTTRAEIQNVQVGFKAGCNDYVTKPVNGIELRDKVAKLIGA